METTTFLHRYQVSLGPNQNPIELQRTPRGITYFGHEIESGREVAIELVPATLANPRELATLEKTAAAAKQINQINLPVLQDAGIQNEQLVYVTDTTDGHTAEAWVAARGPLPLAAVLRVASQVTAALGAVSFHKLQHPAINPANILFVSDGRAEGDWPAIKVLHWLGPHPVLPRGIDARADTAARYLSPEQAGGVGANFASSIFSLGCTMSFLLTGKPPAAPDAPGARVDVASLRGVPKVVRHLLARMLSVDPAERPQDPVALQAELESDIARVERRKVMSRRRGFGSSTSSVRTVGARPREHWPRRELAIAAVLLLLGTLAVVALPRILRSRRWAFLTVPRERAVATAQTPVALVSNRRRDKDRAEPAAPAEGPVEAAVSTRTPPAAAVVAAVATPTPAQSEPTVEVSSPEPKPTVSAEIARNAPPPTEQASPAPIAAAVVAAAATPTPAEAEPTVEVSSPAPTVAAEIVRNVPPPTEQASPAPTAVAVLVAAATPTPAEAEPSVEVSSPAPTVTAEVARNVPPPTEQASPAPSAAAVVAAAVTPAPAEAEPTVEVSSPAPTVAAEVVRNVPPPTEEASPAPTAVAVLAAAATPTPAQAEPTPEDSPPEPEAPAQVTEQAEPVLSEATPAPIPTAAPYKEKTKLAAKHSERKSRKTHGIAQSEKAAAPSHEEHRIARGEVRRAIKIPHLRVNSKPAELVGTTKDGHWILSVDSSGEQVVVPPPPGFAH